jgi:hypothetical protein
MAPTAEQMHNPAADSGIESPESPQSPLQSSPAQPTSAQMSPPKQVPVASADGDASEPAAGDDSEQPRPFRASTLLESPDLISKVPLTIDGVFALCKQQVKTDLLTAHTANLCVDGTSCTKKTSILAVTKRLVLKTSRMGVSNENTDSNGPCMLGHFTAGTYEVLGSPLHLHDRAPNSAHIWYVYWSLFNILKEQGNRDYFPDYVLDHVRAVFGTLIQSHIFDHITGQQFNTIALVDSDVDRCDRLRTKRNCGSDAERSKWGIYTPLQNCLYQALYPGLYIDMAWFGPTDDSIVVQGVAKFLIAVQDGLVKRFGMPSGKPPFTLLSMPTAGDDITLANMRVHMERSLARVQHPRWPYPSDWTSEVRFPVEPMDGFVVTRQLVNGLCAQEWAKESAKRKRAAEESAAAAEATPMDTEAEASFADDEVADDSIETSAESDMVADDKETDSAPSPKRLKVPE